MRMIDVLLFAQVDTCASEIFLIMKEDDRSFRFIWDIQPCSAQASFLRQFRGNGLTKDFFASTNF